jgi:hypothetical protein
MNMADIGQTGFDGHHRRSTVRLNPAPMLEAAAHQLRRSNQMLRKIVIGLVVAASLSATALIPTEASARSLGGRGFGGHRNLGGLAGLGLGLDLVAAGIDSGCRAVVTASGRIFNICY